MAEPLFRTGTAFLAGGRLKLACTTDARQALEGADYVIIATPTNYDTRTNRFDTSTVEQVIAQALYHAPGGMNVRVDSGLYAGYKVPPYYDSMIAKLIVKGRTREGCIMRLKRALEEMVVGGIKTSIPLHQALMNEPDFIHGDYTIKWLEEWLAKR